MRLPLLSPGSQIAHDLAHTRASLSVCQVKAKSGGTTATTVAAQKAKTGR